LYVGPSSSGTGFIKLDQLAVARVYDDDRDPDVFNVVSNRYAIHQYREWLLENVAGLLSTSEGELSIGSAGLLRNGAVAWVQVRPEGLTTIGGDQMLPFILATTSMDGSLATTYKSCMQRVVCDNTLAVGMGERTGTYRVKHTTNSKARFAEAREALDLNFAAVDDFSREVERLMNTECKLGSFRAANLLTDGEKPDAVVRDDGSIKNNRSILNWERRFEELDDLFLTDPRVGDYKNTAYGAWMARNTWSQWALKERDTNAVDTADAKLSQLNGAVDGTIESTDAKFLKNLELVLAE
jgi:phage/plasmid-like protein (TIGR03299 family)